jgi:NAD(P)-dependent dehydrogenase (short-subunit alcohol dehydrogenase family)
MARIFITGSSDGLGQEAARRLVGLGHDVVLHGRNRDRAQEALRAVPAARMALEGDLASIEQTRKLAAQANAAGPFEAIIHNAGVFRPGALRRETVDGLDEVFAVNTLAPYLLTALIGSPQRLIYLTSGMHQSGDADLGDLQWRQRRWNGSQAYANSKLFDLVLAFAVARLWPHVRSNAVDPGIAPTKMAGASAGDLRLGAETQVWLASSEEPQANVTGRCFYQRRTRPVHPTASDVTVHDAFLAACEQLTGVRLASAVRM